jgi:preprotein translocase subunit YajC
MPEKVTEIAGPAVDTLSQTILGSVLIIILMVAIASVYVLVRVQNARVADQKEMSDKLEAGYAKMVEAFGGFQTALISLEKTEESGRQAMTAMRDQLVELASTIRSCPRK